MIKMALIGGVALLTGSVGGCSVDTGEEDVGELTQAFGSSSCGTALADRLYAQDIANPNCISPQDYNTCYKGYVVDVEYLSAAYAGTGSARDARIDVTYAGPIPNTQAACEALWVGAIYYKKVNGAWVDQTGTISAYGQWVLGGCSRPIATSDGSLVLEALSTYRVAGTARPSNGSSTTYPMHIETFPKVNLN